MSARSPFEGGVPRWDPTRLNYAARRNTKRTAIDWMLRDALNIGEHVHIFDGDGEWCLEPDHDVELHPGVRGSSAGEPIYDEIQDWPEEEAS